MKQNPLNDWLVRHVTPKHIVVFLVTSIGLLAYGYLSGRAHTKPAKSAAAAADVEPAAGTPHAGNMTAAERLKIMSPEHQNRAMATAREYAVGPNEIKKSDYPMYKSFAQHQLAQVLRDPDSARLSHVMVYKSGGKLKAICGTVNAKNGFGGYAGPRPFIISIYAKWEKQSRQKLSPAPAKAITRRWSRMSNPPPVS